VGARRAAEGAAEDVDERTGGRPAAQGLSNDEIADRMVIGPLTARTHINRAMVDFHARDRVRLVVLAYASGLVAPHAPG
jgi:hypothetical protein